MNTKDKIEVMQAFEEGKPIQLRTYPLSQLWKNWTSEIEPNWNWEKIEYRVKPELQTVYLNIYPRNVIVQHKTQEEADHHATPERIGRKRVEFYEGEYDV